MKIEKRFDHLCAISNIYFDESACFSGRTYIYLIAYKDKVNYEWNANTIGIAIHDNDDFDVGVLYQPDADNFINTLHELLNWMYDHEHGISNYESVWDAFNFFPNLGCNRERW